jgi:hypothetical protein
MSIWNPDFTNIEERTLSGDLTLTWDDAEIQLIDPDGADRKIILPDPADFPSDQAGGSLLIFHNADRVLTNPGAAYDSSTNPRVNLIIETANFYSTSGHTRPDLYMYAGCPARFWCIGIDVSYTIPGNVRTETAYKWIGGMSPWT